jgi:phosphoglycolate phosphatase
MSEASGAALAAAVIFDLDGTLADTLHDIAAAMNHALARHGLPAHEPQHYRAFIGHGVSSLVEQAAGTADVELCSALASEFRSHYALHQLDRTRPYPGIEPLLEELARRAVPISVLSNKPDDATLRIVEALFPGTPFVRVAGQRADWPRKPDPARALSLAAEMDVPQASCAFVGDSGIDMQTASNAGQIPVGVLWGFRDAAELRAHGARVLLSRPDQLLELFGQARAQPPS